jgi:hypothetical protein
MKDYLASIEKLRRDASEAALIRDLATDQAKREMFDRLCQHLDRLADEVEKAMNSPETPQARQVAGEYASDQRAILKKLCN